MSNNVSYFKTITRAGSEPRIRSCIFDKKEIKPSYLHPNFFPIELKGKGKQHIEPMKALEINPFSKKILKEFPNSHRTLDPKLAPKPLLRPMSKCFSVQKMQSNPVFCPDTQNNYLFYQNTEPTERKHRINTHYQYKDNVTLTTEGNNLVTFYKRSRKSTIYSQNATESQISLLPGGAKRKENNINDFKPIPKYSRSAAYCTKINNEYFSNVTCLPGRFTKETESNNNNNATIEHHKRHHTQSDIFNVKTNYTSFRSLNNGIRKTSESKQSEACQEFMVPISRKGKVENLRVNLFKSQIQIL